MPEEKDPAALRPTAEHVFAARFPGYCDIGHDTSHVRRMWGVRLMPAYALDKVTLP